MTAAQAKNEARLRRIEDLLVALATAQGLAAVVSLHSPATARRHARVLTAEIQRERQDAESEFEYRGSA